MKNVFDCSRYIKSLQQWIIITSFLALKLIATNLSELIVQQYMLISDNQFSY